MSVFRTYPVEFKGVTYHVTGSLALIKKLEQQQIYLARMASNFEGGDDKLSNVIDLATMISMVLETGGAVASADEIFQMLVHSNSDKSVQVLIQSCITALLPPAPGAPEKKQIAPAKKKEARNRG